MDTHRFTHARPGVPSIVRESAFRYDTVTGILDQEVIEPNGAADETLTSTYVLDAFGNRVKQTTVAAGEPARVTDWVYDPYGRFVSQTKNGLGQTVEQISSRDAFGNPLAVSDINGVVSERSETPIIFSTNSIDPLVRCARNQGLY